MRDLRVGRAILDCRRVHAGCQRKNANKPEDLCRPTVTINVDTFSVPFCAFLFFSLMYVIAVSLIPLVPAFVLFKFLPASSAAGVAGGSERQLAADLNDAGILHLGRLPPLGTVGVVDLNCTAAVERVVEI